MLRQARPRGRPRRGRRAKRSILLAPALPRGVHGLPDAGASTATRRPPRSARPRLRRRRVPIIAMTAHALEGERERCLRCRHGRLSLQAPARRGPRRGAGALGPRRADRRHHRRRRDDAGPLVDEAHVRSFNVDYRSMADELWAVFYRVTPPLIGELRDAVERGDDDESRRLAHKLKGSSATVGATRMAALSTSSSREAPTTWPWWWRSRRPTPGRGTSCSAWRHSPDQAGSTALPARAASCEQPRILGSPPRDTWLKLRRVDRAINGPGVDTCLPRPPRRCTRCSKLRSTPRDLDAFMEIYDDDATLIVPPDGQRVSGRDAIRAAVQPTLALRPSAQIEVVEKLQTRRARPHPRALEHRRDRRRGARGDVGSRHDRLASAARRQLAHRPRQPLEPRMSPRSTRRSAGR